MSYGEPWRYEEELGPGHHTPVELYMRVLSSDEDEDGCEIVIFDVLGSQAMAERAVACVNALAGLDPEAVKEVLAAAWEIIHDFKGHKRLESALVALRAKEKDET